MKGPSALMAEFAGASPLLEAVRQARSAGYRKVEAYTPFAIDGLDEALGLPRTRLPGIMLLFGILGAIAGFLLQTWVTLVAFPYNAGGRPLFSWPPYTLLCFELAVLGAAAAGFFGMLAMNGLPRFYHPVFDAANFERASQDRFFLAIDASDPKFEATAVRTFLESLNPLAVVEVPEWEEP